MPFKKDTSLVSAVSADFDNKRFQLVNTARLTEMQQDYIETLVKNTISYDWSYKSIVADNEDIIGIAAIDKETNQILGVIVFSFFMWRNAIKAGRIEILATDPKYRMDYKGLGALLLSASIRIFKKEKAKRIFVDFTSASLGFYLKCGMNYCSSDLCELNLLTSSCEETLFEKYMPRYR